MGSQHRNSGQACRADGQLVIPPFVVHESQELSAYFAKYLPTDWGIHVTKSGYMDRDGWFKICKHFMKYCGATRPLYLFFDGHDSVYIISPFLYNYIVLKF